MAGSKRAKERTSSVGCGHDRSELICAGDRTNARDGTGGLPHSIPGRNKRCGDGEGAVPRRDSGSVAGAIQEEAEAQAAAQREAEARAREASDFCEVMATECTVAGPGEGNCEENCVAGATDPELWKGSCSGYIVSPQSLGWETG